MKRKRYSDEKIAFALGRAESSTAVNDSFRSMRAFKDQEAQAASAASMASSVNLLRLNCRHNQMVIASIGHLRFAKALALHRTP